MRIIYDGWALVHQPASSTARLVWDLLHLPLADFERYLALPAHPPQLPLPPDVQIIVQPTPATPAGRLDWEQRRLPALARRRAADWLHLAGLHPPFWSNLPVMLTPGGIEPGLTGWAGRLRRALAAGVAAGAAQRRVRLLLPQALPAPDSPYPPIHLPDCVSPDFNPTPDHTSTALNLPETYVLAHLDGGLASLPPLLAAWSWAAGAISADFPLVIVGIDEPAVRRAALAAAGDLAAGLYLPVGLQPADLPQVYRGCSAVLHLEPAATWGGALRWALACGKPLVSLESPLADALVGPAGYLLPASNPRAQGAALLTTIVEPEVAGRLSQLALERAQIWQRGDCAAALAAAYRSAG